MLYVESPAALLAAAASVHLRATRSDGSGAQGASYRTESLFHGKGWKAERAQHLGARPT
jgi:hypothetical protein